MPERLQQLLNRILEWWNKFTSKQKTAIIAVAAGVVMALAILITFINRPQYILLRQCATTAEASEVNDILVGAGITPEISADGLRIEVEKNDLSDANLLLGANNIVPASYSIDNVTGGGFSDTEADKQRRYLKYYQEHLANDIIGSLEMVQSARVEVDLPESSGFLIEQEEEASALIILTLNGEFSEDQAANLAKGIAGALGSKTPERITIMDNQSNMLFDGSATYSNSTASQVGTKGKIETVVQNNVKRVLLGTNQFDKIEVSANVDIDFSDQTVVEHAYAVAEGREEGFIGHEDHYAAESNSGIGGVPGTDSNGEAGNTTYQYPDNAGSSSTETEDSFDRLVDETITTTTTGPGVRQNGTSSVAITAIHYNEVREEEIREQGLLDGTSWIAYKAANQDQTPITIDPSMISIVSQGTGIPVANIEMLAFSENVFYDTEGFSVSWTDIAQIALIILILALLAVVVIRTMRTGRETAQAEELSVESLLQSQPELELEDISIDQGSEAKKMIDKFVEDNPEAAAALLRNWLNEDWA